MTNFVLHYYITPKNINDIPLEETMKDYFVYGQDHAISLLSRKKISDAWDVVADGEIERTFDGVFQDDLAICERLFEATNIGNLLSSKEAQARIKASKAHHTSMSVGDVVQIDSKFYLCADCGFKDVTDLATKEVLKN